MKSLKERLAKRKAEYEKLVWCEKLAQRYIDKVLTVVPESTNLGLMIYENSAHLSISFDNIEDFEELYITQLSEILGVTWIRRIGNSEISHSTVIREDSYRICIVSISKPTNSCRIRKIPTGRTVKTQKFVEVEEPEFDYLIECSDD